MDAADAPYAYAHLKTAAERLHQERIARITRLVVRELERAERKHRPMNSPHEGSSVIREEFEELWDHVKADTGRTADATMEAIQLAAMGMRYVLNLIDNETVREIELRQR